jgi:hypothetical protein
VPAVVVAVVPATDVVDPDVDAGAPVAAVVPSALTDDVVVAESDELLQAASASAPALPPRNISARRRDIVWMS